MPVKVTRSSEITTRHLKIAFWGKTATRKTETVLRNFPHVLLIDTEGNGELCAGHPDIPEFLYFKTKDPYQVIEAIDDASKGLLKFADGSQVETVMIDSTTVLWSGQQEVAYGLAKKRAEKRGGNANQEVNATQGEWASAKRPMRVLSNHVNASPIKYLVFIAREKDLYKEEGNGVQVKVGVQPDWVKGSDFDMNLIFHFTNEASGWQYEVTKVQGPGLGSILPVGKKGKEFPTSDIISYSLSGKAAEDQTDEEVIERQVNDAEKERSFKSLISFAAQKGIDETNLRTLLKSNGFATYTPQLHDQLEEFVESYASS